MSPGGQPAPSFGGPGTQALRRMKPGEVAQRVLLRWLATPARPRGSGILAPQATKGAVKKSANIVQDLTNQLDQGLNVSILNTLRTGNMIVDMMVCMLVPVLIRWLLTSDFTQMWHSVTAPLRDLLLRSTFTRTIEYTDGGNTRVRFNPVLDDMESHMESTDRNNLLQKAIKLFMSDRYGLSAPEMEVSLVPKKKIHMEVKKDMFGERSKFSGSYAQLLSFGVQVMPAKGQWMLVDKEKSIWFMQQVNEQQVGNEANPNVQTKTVFYIKGTGPSAAQVVNNWIEEAFEWYKERRKSEQDNSRFFYVAIQDNAKKDEKSGSKYLFKQYLLSDHKTFRSLFFPEKDALLTLIDQFTQKKGKFAIEGFPDKLGLLLDGPPGTGKTSLIKALAHHLNRHVVSVNLAKIKTNQELMDLLFDLVFPVQGGDFPVKLKFKDVIFVMEDVDAASKVVYARKGSKKPDKAKKAAKAVGSSSSKEPASSSTEAEAAPKAKAKERAKKPKALDAPTTEQAHGTEASSAHEPPPAGDKGDEGDKVRRTPKAPPPEMPKLLRMISGNDTKKQAGTQTGQDDDKIEDEEDGEEAEEEEEEEAEGAPSPTAGDGKKKESAESMVGEILCKMMSGPPAGPEGPDEARKGGVLGFYSKAFEGDDDLNLAGLLNVLDGVVDSPGRVVVMTTNHPDKLDPALIRPGRINKRIHLGYVCASTMCLMTEHYMQVKLSAEERRQIAEVAKTHSVTPAQMEQCCAESDTVEELVAFLLKTV